MRNLRNQADHFLRTLGWRDAALLKLCLCAVGVLLGLAIPARRRKAAALLAALAFLISWIPLLARFLPSLGSTPIRDIYPTEE